MRSRLVPVLLVAAAAMFVACEDDAGSGGRPGVVNGPADADVADQAPYGPGAEVGATYDYVLYTHCGVEWARIDGVWWRTARLDDGNANPPAGWGNPYDAGRLEIIDDRKAVYEGGPDVRVELERTDLVAAPFVCD